MILDNQRSPAPLPVERAAELLAVSKSGYYSWLKRGGMEWSDTTATLYATDSVTVTSEIPMFSETMFPMVTALGIFMMMRKKKGGRKEKRKEPK